MLTRIVIENFKSFKNRTQIDFTPTKYTILQEKNVSENKVLKGALFIGPNASGKTTALEAIAFLIRMINSEWKKLPRTGCFFSRKSTTNVTYCFRFDGSEVEYRVSVDNKKASLSERLMVDGKVVLTKEGSRGELMLSDEHTVVDDQVDEATSFLRVSAFNTGRFPQFPVLRKLIDFIQNSKYIDGTQLSAILGAYTDAFMSKNGTDKFNSYLEDMHYDFHAEYAKESSGEGITIKMGEEEKTILKRNSFAIPIPFIAESQGNKVFMEILSSMIPVIEKPGMIVVDEFGNSLHNMLAEHIVTYFMEKSENSQMFLTSHCTNLLSNAVLRPDQIYAVTFNGKDGSSTRRLSDFKPREAQNLEKMYLGGMFDGLPNYGEAV